MAAVPASRGFDFRAIEVMDPSIADGYRIVYDRDVPFELRLREGAGALEAIKVKVLVCGDDAAPHSARIELASESDVFFHFMHVIDEVGFQMMQEQQKLMAR